jgi:ATP-dependent Lon protease
MIDVHLHLPAGAQKKDGPSAGVAMVRSPRGFGPEITAVDLVQVCAMVSLLTGKYVPPTTAMTGEVRQKIVTTSFGSALT